MKEFHALINYSKIEIENKVYMPNQKHKSSTKCYMNSCLFTYPAQSATGTAVYLPEQHRVLKE